MEFSVPMALADFVPIVLFLIGEILLQRELYPRLSKGQFALFAAGTIGHVLHRGAQDGLQAAVRAWRVRFYEAQRSVFAIRAFSVSSAARAISARCCSGRVRSFRAQTSCAAGSSCSPCLAISASYW